MDIKGFIEWVGHDSGSAVATVFPYLLVGIVGLYLLSLVVGYLRASQVGLATEHEPASAVPLLPASAAPGASSGFPRGVPYCPTDNLAYTAGALFCPRCEGDLLVDCANCGTTIRAADPSCFHCGTHQTLARVSDED
jgi:hypothetical protein